MEEQRTRKPNGRSSIYLGADKLWHGWVTVGVKQDGSLDRRHVKRKTEKSATQAVQALEKQRDAGKSRKAGRSPTVQDWMTVYLDTIAVQKVAPRTYDDYWSKTRNWIIPLLGQHRLDRLEAEHLDAMYGSMFRAKLAPSHVLKVHRILSRALKIAVRRGKVARNVAELIDPPTAERVEQQHLSRGESRNVLAACAGRRNGARWSVGLACGLRQGEVLGLRWQYVDLETGDVRIWWQAQRNTWRHGCTDAHACGSAFHKKSCKRKCATHKGKCPRPCPPGCVSHARHCPDRHGGGVVFRKPKGTGRRTITLPGPLVALLRRQRTRQQTERQTAGSTWEDWDLVFCQPNGRPIDHRKDWEEWGELLRAAGVRYVRPHDARHTAGTLLAEQGVHVRTIQAILGHSDVRTTEGYTHVSSQMTRDAAELMGSALWAE
ncbi:tyrosine-type recombinase/integrase [Actinoalloteichus hymeniacidonis]|uniref:Phage integrase family protein n=1 Tax=Actinoalloteichus hymeniacidonis TaxID=340345 RepID=A0AAC9HLM2_9PSEU|nr:tyrosine-type recombinase/integrase [Actinoalloteichus hymeniacidonis]AOS61145.1 phage integrase family protein [Actinoalloteichus hymeniacidonis]